VTKYNNREKAEDTKKNRIYELWQKEMQAPSVKDLVGQMI